MAGVSERVWVITGASSGFGRELATAALAAGDRVVAAVRRPESVDDLVSGSDGRAEAVRLDVTDQERCTEVVDEVIDRHGRIDVLVNNAGTGLVGAGEETTDAELRELMELHFFGPVALTRAVLPHMRASKAGAIVQMSSQGGRFSFPGVGAYSASKFALEGWSEALSGEVAPYGIRVLIVEPGAFRTSFNKSDVLRTSKPDPAYADTVGPVRDGLAGADGAQPGDPAKAAKAILTALEAGEVPLRLPLGNDAVDGVIAALDKTRADVAQWESVSRSTDVD